MSLFDKLFGLFYKKPTVSLVEKDTELYELVKQKMDKFEETVEHENVQSLVFVVKHLLVETQMLKETIKNQNEVLNNLVLTNQRLSSTLESMIVSVEEMESQEGFEEEDDISETATERSKRNALRKFGLN